MALQVIQAGQTRTRKTRTPNFPIAGILRPFGLYPLMIHPVLPGETLQSARTLWRVGSKPLKFPLGGAWLETWLVYVKLTDIDRSLGQMFVSDSFPETGYTAAATSNRYFTQAGMIDWVRLCTEKVAKSYFLHANETLRNFDGVPKIKLNAKTWMANMMFEPASYSTAEPSTTSGAQVAMTAFELMQQATMSELTYEKYLEQFGVASGQVRSEGEPEILRFTRSWTQPTNTVEPSTGSPSSSWWWSDKMELDKPKFFEEPGFIIQLAAIRPKMFYKYQQASIVGRLWGFTDFFPIYNLDDPSYAVRKLNTTADVFDPLANAAEAGSTLLYDHLDVLNHGEQFINSSSTGIPYTLPMASVPNLLAASQPEDIRGEYCSDQDITDLFASATAPNERCFYDGITSLRITGHVKDLMT